MNDTVLRLALAGGLGVITMILIAIDSFLNKRINRRYGSLDLFSKRAPVVVLFLFLGFALAFPDRFEYLMHEQFELLLLFAAATIIILGMTPLLRKKLSSKSCAELWILPSVTLYLLFLVVCFSGRRESQPWIVIHIPRSLLRLMVILWLTGFCTVMMWKAASHLRFRRAILREAKWGSEHDYALFRKVLKDLVPIKSSHVVRVDEDYERGRKLRIVRSSEVSSPLTIGLFDKTSCLVLPDQEYTDQELQMIFRHECIHLMHEDNRLKFSASVWCAFGWFIPTLWIGMKRMSEDMELCCDELVTEGMGPSERKEYADLLLQTAGTEKGFTTCLCASAQGLRYRLHGIMRPKERKNGILVMGLLAALGVFFFGTVGISMDVGTVQTELLNQYSDSWKVTEVEISGRGDYWHIETVEKHFGELRLAKELWHSPQTHSNYPLLTSDGTIRIDLQQIKNRTMSLWLSPDADGRLYLYNDGVLYSNQIGAWYRVLLDDESQAWLRSMGIKCQ